MNSSNLKKLRKTAKLTQEAVAEKLNVSRQSVAKWESGEALPDIDNCMALARLYGVTLDDLVMYAKNPDTEASPSGKHMFGVLKIDEKGRVIIPQRAMEVFGLKHGDKLLLMGDEEQGLAMVKLGKFLAATAEIMNIIKETDPDERDEK